MQEIMYYFCIKKKKIKTWHFWLSCCVSQACTLRCGGGDICRKLWPTSSGASGMLKEKLGTAHKARLICYFKPVPLLSDLEFSTFVVTSNLKWECFLDTGLHKIIHQAHKVRNLALWFYTIKIDVLWILFAFISPLEVYIQTYLLNLTKIWMTATNCFHLILSSADF